MSLEGGTNFYHNKKIHNIKVHLIITKYGQWQGKWTGNKNLEVKQISNHVIID
jgi:hypothetical protein